MRGRTPRRGLTLIEVMVALSLVAMATLALVSANTFASRTASRSYRHHVAMRLAQQRLDFLLLGEDKLKLSADAMIEDGERKEDAMKADSTVLDCDEAGRPRKLCDGSAPALVGWVDVYGRPCRRDGKPEEGYHPTCQYRRYVSYKMDKHTGSSETWRVFVAVSHEQNGDCVNFTEGDVQCVVTSAILTR